jgi:hypothetical protein
MMLWNIRRRPSIFATILRSALMVGAAVCVPVGLEVLRRVIQNGRSGSQSSGASSQRANHSGRASASTGSRRRRSASLARAS